MPSTGRCISKPESSRSTAAATPRSSGSGASARRSTPSSREKQEEQRKRLTAFVERFRAKATKARQAQSRLKLLAKLEPVAAVVANEVRPIVFPPPAKPLSPPIIALEGVSVGYEPTVRCCGGSICGSIPTTALRWSAPTATASRRW